MRIKLLKLKPRIKDRVIWAYLDIELLDKKIKIKGVSLAFKKNQFFVRFPCLLTEEKIKYTPFNFTDNLEYEEFKNSLLDTVQKTYPLSEWSKGIYLSEEICPKS